METLKCIPHNLSEDTRQESITIWRKVYSAHLTKDKEIAITDHSDESKIYALMSRQFYNFLMDGEQT